jgi:hypothetical protein
LTVWSVSPYWLGETRSAVDPCRGLAGFPPANGERCCKQLRLILSATSAFLQSLDFDPTLAPRICFRSVPTGAPLLGLPSLQHMPATRVHSSASIAKRPPRSALRVWLPSRRLTPLDAWSGLFRPDSVPGISPCGEFSSREVEWGFPKREPTCRFSPRLAPVRRSAPAGRRSRQLLGFGPPPESRGRPLVFSLREAGCSLGVFPFQGSTAVRLAAKLSPAAPLTRFARTARRRTGRRLRVSISGSTGPTRQPPGEPDDTSQATLIGFACLFDPTGSRHKRFGLMDSPRGQPAVTDQRNPALRTYRALAGAPWEST